MSKDDALKDFWIWVETKYELDESYFSNKKYRNLVMIGFLEEYLAEQGVGVGLSSNTFLDMHKGTSFGQLRLLQLTDAIKRRI